MITRYYKTGKKHRNWVQTQSTYNLCVPIRMFSNIHGMRIGYLPQYNVCGHENFYKYLEALSNSPVVSEPIPCAIPRRVKIFHIDNPMD